MCAYAWVLLMFIAINYISLASVKFIPKVPIQFIRSNPDRYDRSLELVIVCVFCLPAKSIQIKCDNQFIQMV